MEDQQTMRRKRSEPLTKTELKALKAYRKQFKTEVACAISLGIDRTVLSYVLLKGSSAPETVEKIRARINNGQ